MIGYFLGFNECKSLSPASKMQTISQQIIHHGNTYVQHPRYFPISKCAVVFI